MVINVNDSVGHLIRYIRSDFLAVAVSVIAAEVSSYRHRAEITIIR